MVQTCQDDTSTELSGPGEPGLTMRMVEKGIQQHKILCTSCICLNRHVSHAAKNRERFGDIITDTKHVTMNNPQRTPSTFRNIHS